MIGDNAPQVSGYAPNFDSTAPGIALQKLYVPAIQTVGREFSWDFARNTQPLSLTANTPPFPWKYEYLYPTNCIQIWQVMPATLADANNPLPINWSVGNDEVAGVQTKVVFSNVANAQAVFNNYPAESLWDPMFREAVVRLLAAELAIALEGRPDTSSALMESGSQMENIAEGRDS